MLSLMSYECRDPNICGACPCVWQIPSTRAARLMVMNETQTNYKPNQTKRWNQAYVPIMINLAIYHIVAHLGTYLHSEPVL